MNFQWPVIGPQLQQRDKMIQIYNIKKILLSLFLFLLIGAPLISHADSRVTLQWDANNPVVEGYQVFGREEGQNYDYDTFLWQGDYTYNQCTIDGLDENKDYFFIVRAFSGDDVSGDSNEVRFAHGDNSILGGGGGGSGSGCFVQSVFR